MSRNNRSRRMKNFKKTDQYNSIDNQCERQAGSMITMRMIGPVQPSRLNFTYMVDGYKFNTGKRHRGGGGIGVNPKRQDRINDPVINPKM